MIPVSGSKVEYVDGFLPPVIHDKLGWVGGGCGGEESGDLHTVLVIQNFLLETLMIKSNLSKFIYQLGFRATIKLFGSCEK